MLLKKHGILKLKGTTCHVMSRLGKFLVEISLNKQGYKTFIRRVFMPNFVLSLINVFVGKALVKMSTTYFVMLHYSNFIILLLYIISYEMEPDVSMLHPFMLYRILR